MQIVYCSNFRVEIYNGNDLVAEGVSNCPCATEEPEPMPEITMGGICSEAGILITIHNIGDGALEGVSYEALRDGGVVAEGDLPSIGGSDYYNVPVIPAGCGETIVNVLDAEDIIIATTSIVCPCTELEVEQNVTVEGSCDGTNATFVITNNGEGVIDTYYRVIRGEGDDAYVDPDHRGTLVLDPGESHTELVSNPGCGRVLLRVGRSAAHAGEPYTENEYRSYVAAAVRDCVCSVEEEPIEVSDSIELAGECKAISEDETAVLYVITNTGEDDMTEALGYRIYRNEILEITGTYQLEGVSEIGLYDFEEVIVNEPGCDVIRIEVDLPSGEVATQEVVCGQCVEDEEEEEEEETTDSDGAGISDEEEGEDDQDGDSIPNDEDTDSDGDGINDEEEGTDDQDGDSTPNYLDTDSDGDGVSDQEEETEDSDGDGIPNYLDNDNNTNLNSETSDLTTSDDTAESDETSNTEETNNEETESNNDINANLGDSGNNTEEDSLREDTNATLDNEDNSSNSDSTEEENTNNSAVDSSNDNSSGGDGFTSVGTNLLVIIFGSLIMTLAIFGNFYFRKKVKFNN